MPLARKLKSGRPSWVLVSALSMVFRSASRKVRRLSKTYLWSYRGCRKLIGGPSPGSTCHHPLQLVDGSLPAIWSHLCQRLCYELFWPSLVCPTRGASWHSNRPGKCPHLCTACPPSYRCRWSRCSGLDDHWPPRAMPWGSYRSADQGLGFKTVFQWHQAGQIMRWLAAQLEDHTFP